MKTQKGPILSDMALTYAKAHAAKVYDGRRGHGSANAGRALMSRAEFEDNLAIAFESGQGVHANISRVRS